MRVASGHLRQVGRFLVVRLAQPDQGFSIGGRRPRVNAPEVAGRQVPAREGDDGVETEAAAAARVGVALEADRLPVRQDARHEENGNANSRLRNDAELSQSGELREDAG